MVGLYLLDDDGGGGGQLVSALALGVRDDLPTMDVRESGLREIQRLARAMKSRGYLVRFVHFKHVDELRAYFPALEDHSQISDEFWTCLCETGAIHSISRDLSGFCTRCSTAEEHGALAEISDVFFQLGANFDTAAAVQVWETNADTPSGRKYFGGFRSRSAAENAIHRYYLHLTILTDTLPAEFRPPPSLRIVTRRDYIDPARWEIFESE